MSKEVYVPTPADEELAESICNYLSASEEEPDPEAVTGIATDIARHCGMAVQIACERLVNEFERDMVKVINDNSAKLVLDIRTVALKIRQRIKE